MICLITHNYNGWIIEIIMYFLNDLLSLWPKKNVVQNIKFSNTNVNVDWNINWNIKMFGISNLDLVIFFSFYSFLMEEKNQERRWQDTGNMFSFLWFLFSICLFILVFKSVENSLLKVHDKQVYFEDKKCVKFVS